ncbi:hypothetical protein [Vibrio phage vB_pir03]|nr:hypothetical protein [Vibrio phage vB_pir03]
MFRWGGERMSRVLGPDSSFFFFFSFSTDPGNRIV